MLTSGKDRNECSGRPADLSEDMPGRLVGGDIGRHTGGHVSGHVGRQFLKCLSIIETGMVL